MRRLTASLAVLILFAVGFAVDAAQAQNLLLHQTDAAYQRGVGAYDRGDYATALREMTPLAEQGIASAQFNLGQMYRRGEGVSKDYKTAVKWYTLAAEQGHADAQYNLGVAYDLGAGVLQDHEEAVKWWTFAAEQGNADAYYNLGGM